MAVSATRCYLKLAELAAQAKAEGRAQPQKRVEQVWRFPDFRYGEDGPNLGIGSGIGREVSDWTKAAEELLPKVRELVEYKELLAGLETTEGSQGVVPTAFLEGQVRDYLSLVLRSETVSADLARTAVDDFERGYRGLPVRHGARVRLAGLVMPEGEIRVDHRDLVVVLRPVEKSDVEVPVTAGQFQWLFVTDSIGELRMSGRPFLEVQAQEQRLLAILRLYCGCNASPISSEYTGHGISVGPMMGNFAFPGVWRKVKLRQTDRQGLQAFWDRLADLLPQSFVNPGLPALEATSVASERYKDSLDFGRSFERCITSAVMGLEALYFKPSGEQAELVYRLSLRVSRFLTLLGKDPAKTRETIEIAYDVRSGYVHGGKASQKDRRKIERLYGSLDQFQVAMLDLLRISIVAAILRTVEKEEFIDALDDALMDPGKVPRLEALAAEAKKLLGTARSA